MPCSSCKARGHSCRMISSNSRCSECVRRGRKCDATSVPITNLGRLNQEKKKLELQESEVEDDILRVQQEIARLQRESSEKFNRLLRLRKQKRLLQSRSEAEAVRLDAELSVEDAVERDRLGVDELPFDGPSESGLVPELRSLGHVDVVDWSSVLGADPQDWVFADLAPGNDPTPGSIDGVVPGNSGGG
ncbi:hypothetical protein, variant [Pyricularia oryzae 70-15]|uniref:Zn(2)-C6 fungal-type domain-containing protein n=1 Tax=Pyricularia oryzae (strain 70-15 / ATCC MYA-4617 / FGSC 8958) TaxID=242507 RepID=G4MVV2_PYRO7|nr:hypothetical protein, variant [Pyricularia oryzae 70-15]EHA55819.1 hypothetical protein, variant [Pyricularia oryzae 70-15]